MKATPTVQRKMFTPPEVAKLFGVDPAKVLAWIRAGELQAVDASTRRGSSKPRFRIAEEAIEEFKRRRAVVPLPPVKSRRGKKKNFDLSRFFGSESESEG